MQKYINLFLITLFFIITYSSKSQITEKIFIDNIKFCVEISEVNPKVNLELTITQAALESNYGKSRFAKKGNNYFGIKTFSNEGMLPEGMSSKIRWRMKVYDNMCESVDDYMMLLNNSKHYVEYRNERDYQIKNNINDPIRYFDKLNGYAENPIYPGLLRDRYREIKTYLDNN